jgi:hypothetical protein
MRVSGSPTRTGPMRIIFVEFALKKKHCIHTCHTCSTRSIAIPNFHITFRRTQRKNYRISRCDSVNKKTLAYDIISKKLKVLLYVEERKCDSFPKIITILAGHFEMLIKLFLNQWIILDSNSVPHKVFLWLLKF